MRRRSGILVALSVASGTLFMAACGAGESGPPDRARDSAAWQAVPAGPLGPREGALGLWTGREVLLIGGSNAPPCPPNASCIPPDVPPLADGAAFDPETGAWRKIADSPVPFEWAQGIVVGTTAYLWVPGSIGRPKADVAFLAYRAEENRWQQLPLPPGDPDLFHGIMQAGDQIVAYAYSDEQGEQPDVLFDPGTSAWKELPPDPLSPSFDRSMAWSGRELVLFDHELVPNPGSEKPALTRAAALDLETGTWRPLPDSRILATGPWVLSNGRLVNPVLGGADGGEVENWGRTYPYGGIFDPESGEWSPLPDPPDGEEDWGSGVLTESGGHYYGHRGWILDTATNEWIELPPLDADEHVTGRSVVSAGDGLLVFGGARWSGLDGTLLDDAWMWLPRASPNSHGSDRNADSGASTSPSSTPSSSTSSESSVSVPDVVGLGESEAVRALGASGLVANVRYAYDAPRTGKVLHSDPEAGNELRANSAIVLSIALGPRLPTPGQEDEMDIHPLGSVVQDHPEVFVGLYRDAAGVPHVVFGPGVDPETWDERLRAAAERLHYPREGVGYRPDMCSRDLKTLRAMQDEIAPAGRATKWWTKNERLAFGVEVHPETCTVRVESDLLTPDDIEALVNRYNTAISFDTTECAHPVLLQNGRSIRPRGPGSRATAGHAESSESTRLIGNTRPASAV
jgi:hypothetical protein